MLQRFPEPRLVGPLVAPEYDLGRLPAAELAEHLQRLIHEVRGKFPPERVPAPATLRFQAREFSGNLSMAVDNKSKSLLLWEDRC